LCFLICPPSFPQGAGEQTLLARLVRRRPDLFAGHVICFDRNFPAMT
jgi:hypothetical protein